MTEAMTHERWKTLSRAERARLMDRSDLHPQLADLIGRKVRVHPKREYGVSTFWVGITTGWKPILLAIRNRNQRGSSDLIRKEETFTRVVVID